MGVFENTITFIWNRIEDVLTRLAIQIPTVFLGLLVALLFIVIGWILGNFAKKLLIELLKFAKLDEWAKEHNLRDAVGGMHLSHLAGSFLKWYIIMLFLTQAIDAVQLDSLKTFLSALVFFIPLLLFAMAILVLGMVLGKFIRNRIEATNHKFKKTIGQLSEMIIVYLAVVLALGKIGFDTTILENAFLVAFSAFVIVLALVFGISLALAYKDDIKDIVYTIKKEIKGLQ